MPENPYLDFGPGADAAAWLALAAAVVSLGALTLKQLPGICSRLQSAPRPWLLACLSLTAVALSAGYLAHYLRGGPRIIDATHYYLQGRALSHGYFAFPVPEPEASFNGRFLLSAKASGALGVLFPPGYPLALALAFRLGVPLALGPVLAGALVVATYALARAFGCDKRTAHVAAGLSLLCAALRYHTADTMSHGLSALLGALAIVAASRGTRAGLFASGLCLGWLIATRPVTGIVFLLAVLAFAHRKQWSLVWVLPGMLPGVGLILLHQHALTGSFFDSTQLAYYARADGPPGCMRYGFGDGIGCWFEHGDYVKARLPNGYGVAEATATTLRRLAVHGLDIANAAPLALGVPLAVYFGRRQHGVRVAGAVVVGVVIGYAPFYFEGSFPGGGARFFTDILPVEHVLLARALGELGMSRFAWPLSLAGFGLHTHTQHVALSEREGGRPMFERKVLREAGVERGLVFVSTDHGFALGHEPGGMSAATGLVVARRRHDALDRLLWERLGRPPAQQYDYDPGRSNTVPSLSRVSFPPEGRTARIEAESLWPPLRVSSGWSQPQYANEACVSRSRGLRNRATPRPTTISLRIPPLPRPAQLSIGWIGAAPPLDARWSSSRESGRGSIEASVSGGSPCSRFERVALLPSGVPLELELSTGDGLLDYLDLEWESEQEGGQGTRGPSPGR